MLLAIATKFKRPLLCGVAGVSLLTGTGKAWAQESQDTRLEPQAIVVTAQRREESVLDVPSSIVAVSGAEMRDTGVMQATDLIRLAPSLNFSNTGPTPIFTIRGVGPLNFQPTAESPIAYYVDEVYQAATFAIRDQMVDVKRVEVLNGPQGTLFGRNATGGLIHVISEDPGDFFSGRVSALYGSNDRRMIEGGVSVPISDQVRTRTSFSYEADDGWQKNLVTNTRLAATDRWYLREIIDIDLSSELTARLNIHGGESHGTNAGYGLLGLVDPVDGTRCSPEETLQNLCVDRRGFKDPDPDPRQVFSDFSNLDLDTSSFGGNLRLEYEMPSLTVVSVTAFEENKQYYEEDFDASPAPIFGLQVNTDSEQWSQELRAFGGVGALQWNVGGYYFKQTVSGAELLPQLGASSGNYVQKTNSYALFAQADYELVPSWTVTAGARYTNETRKVLLSDNFEAPSFVENNQAEANEITWRFALTKKFDSGLMAYASVSTGFKSPAFNTSAFVPGASTPSAPEKITNYEAGLKGAIDWAGMIFTAAVFKADYEDIQLITIPSNATSPDPILFNARGADVLGFEASLSATPIKNLDVNFTATLLRTEIDAPGVLVGGNPIDGNDLPRSPNASISGSLEYTIPANNLGEFTLQLSARHQSQHFINPASTPLHEIEAYTLVNGGISWRPDNSNFNVQLLVENLLDKEYFTYAFNFAGLNALQWGLPRRTSVRLSYEW